MGEAEQTVTRSDAGGCFEVAGGEAAMAVFKTEEQLEYERALEERSALYEAKLAAMRKAHAKRDPFKEFRRGYEPPPPQMLSW